MFRAPSVEDVSGSGFAGGGLRGYRIFVRVQHPAWLGREIHARWAEDVDENIEVGIDGLRCMNGRRRYHGYGWRSAAFVIVVAPLAHVRRPWPAPVVDKGAGQRQRALFEVVMVVRRHFGGIARTVFRLEEIHHEG